MATPTQRRARWAQLKQFRKSLPTLKLNELLRSDKLVEVPSEWYEAAIHYWEQNAYEQWNSGDYREADVSAWIVEQLKFNWLLPSKSQYPPVALALMVLFRRCYSHLWGSEHCHFLKHPDWNIPRVNKVTRVPVYWDDLTQLSDDVLKKEFNALQNKIKKEPNLVNIPHRHYRIGLMNYTPQQLFDEYQRRQLKDQDLVEVS